MIFFFIYFSILLFLFLQSLCVKQNQPIKNYLQLKEINVK